MDAFEEKNVVIARHTSAVVRAEIPKFYLERIDSSPDIT